MPGEIPSEFALFVRDAGLRAVDRLSERTKEFPTPIRAVLRSWSKLTEEAKAEMLDALIATSRLMHPEDEEVSKPAKKKSSSRKSSSKKR